MAWFMQMDSRSQIDANLNRVSLESVEALSAEHQREGQSAGFSEEGPFDQLPDDLTEEFLCRLPLLSVLRFRCVCKGWRSLTTSPRFLQRLEHHHNLLEKDRPVGLLLQGNPPKRDKQLVVCSGVPKFKCFEYSLDFLPVLSDHDDIVLSGSCNDLLLCGKEEWYNTRHYFIMNSFTREWAALPPILQVSYVVLTGFVCDPTSISEAKKEANLRYRVVQIPKTGQSETELNVDIFSSEDGQWNKYVMRCDAVSEMSFCCAAAVACNGSLYWKSRRLGGNILALDPFNPMKKEVVVIESPPFYARVGETHLGIHRGKLRMSQTILSVSVCGFWGTSGLHFWELEEGEGGAKWRSIKGVSLDGIIAANPSYLNLIKSRHGSGHPSWKTLAVHLLAVHPMDGDIIYFACFWLSRIIICNLKTSRLEIVRDINFKNWSSFSSIKVSSSRLIGLYFYMGCNSEASSYENKMPSSVRNVCLNRRCS